MDWTGIVQAASAAVVAVFTGMLVWVARRQARIMETQSEIQRSTLTATQTAAEAAKKSADVAEKSVNDIERPFVLIDKIEPKIQPYMARESSPVPTIPPYVIVSLRNYGRSPALVVRIKAVLDMTPRGQNLPMFPVPVLPLDNIVVIGPHESWTRECRHGNLVGEGVKSQIENATFIFWFFLTVVYEDMLGNEHQTQMRFRYDPKENRFISLQGDDYTIRT